MSAPESSGPAHASEAIPVRVAYAIMAHDRPEQVLALIRALREGSPSCAIFLHWDAKSQLPDRAQLEAAGVDLLDVRLDVLWADYSLVECALALMGRAMASSEFDWFVLHSGACFPLRPLGAIERDLQTAEVDAFVTCRPAGRYRARYICRYFRLPAFRYWHRIAPRLQCWFLKAVHALNETQPLIQVQLGRKPGQSQMGIFWPCHPFREGWRPFKGSCWYTLNRRAVKAVLAACDARPDLFAHYRRTWCPDESVIQTILKHTADMAIGSDNRRFIPWKGMTAHPTTIDAEILEQALASGLDFGRKFDFAAHPSTLARLQSVLRAHATDQGGTSVAGIPATAL